MIAILWMGERQDTRGGWVERRRRTGWPRSGGRSRPFPLVGSPARTPVESTVRVREVDPQELRSQGHQQERRGDLGLLDGRLHERFRKA